MKRIQFYPEITLETRLDTEAKELGVSVSTLVADLLNDHYGLIPKNTLSLTQATTLVLSEVKDYIKNLKPTDEFDLSVSPTFKSIEMVSAGKPSANRANIGRTFAKKIGKSPFSSVTIARRPNGKPKKNLNNATIYTIL